MERRREEAYQHQVYEEVSVADTVYEPDIVVYSQEQCSGCEHTKRMLGRLGLRYTEVNVQEDEAARKHIAELGYTQTPVVEVGNDHWGGFRYEKLKGLAKIAMRETAIDL